MNKKRRRRLSAEPAVDESCGEDSCELADGWDIHENDGAPDRWTGGGDEDD